METNWIINFCEILAICFDQKFITCATNTEVSTSYLGEKVLWKAHFEFLRFGLRETKYLKRTLTTLWRFSLPWFQIFPFEAFCGAFAADILNDFPCSFWSLLILKLKFYFRIKLFLERAWLSMSGLVSMFYKIFSMTKYFDSGKIDSLVTKL